MLDSSRAMHHVLHGYLVTSAYALEADLLVEAGLMGNQTMIGLTPTRHPGNRVNLIRRHQRRGQPHLNAASPGAGAAGARGTHRPGQDAIVIKQGISLGVSAAYASGGQRNMSKITS